MKPHKVVPNFEKPGVTFTCLFCLRTFMRRRDLLWHRCPYDTGFS